MALSASQQKLLDFVPETGEIEYGELHNAVMATIDRGAIEEFHRMRRAGTITVRLDASTIPAKLFVSRPAQGA